MHWYGKKEVRLARKMGHITITGDSFREIGLVLETLDLDDFHQGIKASSISRNTERMKNREKADSRNTY